MRSFARSMVCCSALLAGCGATANSDPMAGAALGGAGASPQAGTSGSLTGFGGSVASAPAAGTGGAAVVVNSAGAGGGGSGGMTTLPSGGGGQAGASGGGVAGGGGGGGGGPVGPACPAGVAFCDDFESYSMGPPAGKWQANGKASNGFSMNVDTMHAWSGAKAFHVSVDYQGDGFASVYMNAKSGITGNTAYARFMMYQSSWVRPHPTMIPGIHARILWLGNVSVDLDFSPSVFTMELNQDTFGPMAHMGPQPILNKWICVQAQFGPSIALTVDGIVTSAPAGGGTGLDTLKFGISTYRTFSTDFWIDDLVVDSKPLECPKK